MTKIFWSNEFFFLEYSKKYFQKIFIFSVWKTEKNELKTETIEDKLDTLTIDEVEKPLVGGFHFY